MVVDLAAHGLGFNTTKNILHLEFTQPYAKCGQFYKNGPHIPSHFLVPTFLFLDEVGVFFGLGGVARRRLTTF